MYEIQDKVKVKKKKKKKKDKKRIMGFKLLRLKADQTNYIHIYIQESDFTFVCETSSGERHRKEEEEEGN